MGEINVTASYERDIWKYLIQDNNKDSLAFFSLTDEYVILVSIQANKKKYRSRNFLANNLVSRFQESIWNLFNSIVVSCLQP